MEFMFVLQMTFSLFNAEMEIKDIVTEVACEHIAKEIVAEYMALTKEHPQGKQTIFWTCKKVLLKQNI